MMKNIVGRFIILFFFLSLCLWYWCHHIDNNKVHQAILYNDMIRALEVNDVKSAKYYAKQLISFNIKSIYYDWTCLLLYRMEELDGHIDKMNIFKKKILMNRDSLFKDIMKNEKKK
ncbi:MAG TPA: hypothetical protein V7792_00440 [Candidatus Azoamicus sp. OHIO2]